MHLEELIEDLNLSFQMDYTEVPLNISSCDMVEFVRRIIVDIANDPRAREYILEFEMDQDRMDVEFDQKLFKRLLNNLIMNAVLHNPPKTKIHIFIHKSDHLQIIIKDNGVGMDEHTRNNLFSKYYQAESAKQSNEGSGLGMAISKQVIIAHKGSIEVISQESEGTSICITIPFRQ
jgi:signal transduction histidine kinase